MLCNDEIIIFIYQALGDIDNFIVQQRTEMPKNIFKS